MHVQDKKEKLGSGIRNWQAVDASSIVSSGNILGQGKNPIIDLVREIIVEDSRTHQMVRDFINSSLRCGAVSVAPDELAALSDKMNTHHALEKKMIDTVESIVFKRRGRNPPVFQGSQEKPVSGV